MRDRRYHGAGAILQLPYALYRDPDAEQNHWDKQENKCYKQHIYLPRTCVGIQQSTPIEYPLFTEISENPSSSVEIICAAGVNGGRVDQACRKVSKSLEVERAPEGAVEEAAGLLTADVKAPAEGVLRRAEESRL